MINVDGSVPVYQTEFGSHVMTNDVGLWIAMNTTRVGLPDNRRKSAAKVRRYFSKIRAHKRYQFEAGQ